MRIEREAIEREKLEQVRESMKIGHCPACNSIDTEHPRVLATVFRDRALCRTCGARWSL